MIFRQLFDTQSYTYTYLISSGLGREALLIDPVKEHVKRYLQLITELELKLVIAMDTHLHADHITGLGDLHQETMCQILMGQQSRAECLSARFTDNETINIDGIKVKTLYTPGHTDDSYCFLWQDNVFTGDTLLIRGTGRTDLQHGSAADQYDSITQRLLTLPEKTNVYPAHDYSGMTISTIGEEKHFNPRLQVSSKQKYIELMDNLNLLEPRKMDIAVPANIKCGIF